MYKSSEFTKGFYKTGEVLKLLDISYDKFRYYDKTNRIKIKRTEKGRRIILREDLLNFLDEMKMLYRDDKDFKETEKYDIIYARVSTGDQASHGDLDRQVLFVVENVKELKNPLILKEVGSGLNDNRPKLLKVLNLVMDNKVNKIYITYKDRLTRFGFNYLETICNKFNVEIKVIKDNTQETTVEQELAKDIMALMASFSGKLYSLRAKESRLKRNEKRNQGNNG